MAKLKIIRDLYTQLDGDFKNRLEELAPSICLLELLKLPFSELLTKLNEKLLSYFDYEEEVFEFNGNRLCITLEDVICLTGLPITGEVLICRNTRDSMAFSRVFRLKDAKRYTIKQITSIAINRTMDEDMRIKAVLLVLIHCFIVPASDGYIETTYVQFVEDLEQINNYAWGAALLAFLIQGIKNAVNKTSVDGNMWVFLSFFLVRIPKLRRAIGIEWSQMDYKVPLLRHIIPTITINHTPSYMENVKTILDNLTARDIRWKPYVGHFSSSHIARNAKFGTLLVPIFCNNHYALHRPHLVPKQFKELEDSNMERIKFQFPNVKRKINKGKFVPDFRKAYKKLIAIWESQQYVQDYLPLRSTRLIVDDGIVLSNEKLKGRLTNTKDILRKRRSRRDCKRPLRQSVDWSDLYRIQGWEMPGDNVGVVEDDDMDESREMGGGDHDELPNNLDESREMDEESVYWIISFPCSRMAC